MGSLFKNLFGRHKNLISASPPPESAFVVSITDGDILNRRPEEKTEAGNWKDT